MFDEFIKSNMAEDGEIISTGFGKVALKKEIDKAEVYEEFYKKFPELMEKIREKGIANLNDFSGYFHITVTVCVVAIGMKVGLFKLMNIHPEGKNVDSTGRITIFITKGDEFDN